MKAKYVSFPIGITKWKNFVKAKILFQFFGKVQKVILSDFPFFSFDCSCQNSGKLNVLYQATC